MGIVNERNHTTTEITITPQNRPRPQDGAISHLELSLRQIEAMSTTTIVGVSTIVHQLSHLFEAWQTKFDNPLCQSGQLKQGEASTLFFVEIYVTGELSLNYSNKIFPEIELTINRHCWIEQDYDNF